MTAPAFTILLPVTRLPDLMAFAADSVLGQTQSDFELFIICDGAPDATVAAARTIAARDHRIQVFAHPKGERHGEAYRHQALLQGAGRFVCQIADDDLWLPNHLQEMQHLLADFEFGQLPSILATPDGLHRIAADDLSDPAVQRRMMHETFNIFGPTAAGYRMETYRRLPVGWSPAPAGLFTDLFMWRKFLALPDITAGTRFGAATSIHFATSLREGWTPEQRRNEIAGHARIIAAPGERDKLLQAAWRQTQRDLRRLAEAPRETIEANDTRNHRLEARHAAACAELAAMRMSTSWRLTAGLRSIGRLIGRRH